MSLNIKNREAEELARQLAAATGESLTQAVTVAVRQRLDRVGHQAGDAPAERAALLRQISADASGRWSPALRQTDHGDLLYDQAGLPR